MAFTTSAFATYLYDKLNKEKEAYCIKEGIDASRKTEFAALGTNSPLFRYAYCIHCLSSTKLTNCFASVMHYESLMAFHDSTTTSTTLLKVLLISPGGGGFTIL
jgi:hypothetical protein